MAAIALVDATKLRPVEVFEQMTLPAAEAIAKGSVVRIDTAGKFTKGNGTTATEAAVYGIASRDVLAGESLTAWRDAVLDGFDVSGLAYWAAVYVADADGGLDTAAGTVSVIAGRVIPAWAQPLGVAADKLLRLRMP